MIYLNNTSARQMVFVPKGRETEGAVVFSMKSTIDLSVVVETRVADLQSDLYVQFGIELPSDIATGEYEYSLSDDMGIISTGLVVVNGQSGVEEYNTSVKYEQYEN